MIIPIGFAISFIVLMAESQQRNQLNLENTEDEELAKPNNRILCNCNCHQPPPIFPTGSPDDLSRLYQGVT